MNLNHYLRKKLYVNRRKEILFKFIYQFYFIFSTMKQGVLQQRRGGLLTNYEQLVEEQNCLTNQINLLQAQLNTFPPGKICIAKCKKYSRHYQSDGHVSTYIPAKNKQLIHDLTAKKYLNLKLEYLSREQQILQSYQNQHNGNPDYSQEFLNSNPEYAEILFPYLKEALIPEQELIKEPFETNQNYPENLRYNSASGNILRSKSEYMIDTALFAANIPFRYKCKLVLNNTTLYPDFTILHPKSKQLVYWEHFGMIDHASYSENAIHKILLFLSNDILPNVNLITTYETKDCPLTYKQIEQVIHNHFLT